VSNDLSQEMHHVILKLFGGGVVTLVGLWSVVIVLAMTVGSELSSGEIAFETNRDGNWEVYGLDLRTGGLHNYTRNPADDLGPAWAPDGRSFTFYSNRDTDFNHELYVLDTVAGEVRRLSEQNGDHRRAVWSPDGQQLVYTYRYGQVHIMDANGTNDRHLVYGFSPTWSPSGGQILYYADWRGELNAEIYIIDTDGHNLVNFSNHAANDWSPAWSQDGKYIAFLSSRDGNAELYVTPTDCIETRRYCGTNTRRLTFNRTNDASPIWSPDNQHILFAAEQLGDTRHVDLFLLDVTSGDMQRLTAGYGDNQSPAWRPD
jgi:TolB protein